MSTTANMNNAELQSLLDTLPETPEQIIAGLDAIAEVMRRVDHFVQTHELSPFALEQLREQIRELRDASREFVGELRSLEVTA